MTCTIQAVNPATILSSVYMPCCIQLPLLLSLFFTGSYGIRKPHFRTDRAALAAGRLRYPVCTQVQIYHFIGVLTLFSLVLYIVVPNRKSRIKYELPGAIFTALGWTIFSYVFSIYVDMSTGFAITYGSLATLVFIMLWLYACMNVLFIGAEMNAHFQGIR